MSKEWTVQSCFDCQGNNTHIHAGDRLTLSESGEPHLVVKRAEQIIMDVGINPPVLEPAGFNFHRSSSRNDHKPSDHFRGHLITLPTAPGCEEVLHLIVGYRQDIFPGDDDDDDTEVVVATKPAVA